MSSRRAGGGRTTPAKPTAADAAPLPDLRSWQTAVAEHVIIALLLGALPLYALDQAGFLGDGLTDYLIH
jgi:hypothetical protein